MTESRFPKMAVLALLAIAILWGYSWTQMKLGVQYSSAFTFAALRNVGGGLALLMALIVTKQPILPKAVPMTFLLGLLQTAGFSGFAAWALVSGGAGKTSILVYTMSFWTLLLAWYFLGERIRGLQWIALPSAHAKRVRSCLLWIVADPRSVSAGRFSIQWTICSVSGIELGGWLDRGKENQCEIYNFNLQLYCL